MTNPLVISIILNTNRREDTLACLASLADGRYPNHKTILLDNASTDGSVEAVREQFPAVQIISLTENLGYAGNNNVGISAALEQGADWIFVINEDTIFDPDCISKLVTAGESDPRIGIVGPMVYHFDEPDVIQSAGGRFDAGMQSAHIAQNEPDTGQFPKPHDVDWISGCAIMLRREVIEQVGVLDERFFYYWEETEWCLRAGRAGWRITHVPQAKMWHKGVQRDYQPSSNVTYYSTRNRLLALSKHHISWRVRAVAWAEIGRTLISWTIKPKWRDMREHRAAMWQGVRDYLYGRWGMRPS